MSQLEEGDVGTLHPIYQVTCEPWITFMAKLGKYYLFSNLCKKKMKGYILYELKYLSLSTCFLLTWLLVNRLPLHSAVHS